ncbi:hypothetical protein LBMAG21_02600 [Armatimonadota bacterium]|nr:hypothetical protein LBMAG21_02600 [Armatimonadota bacterium]
MIAPHFTTVDIVHHHFRHKLNGYAPQEVDDYLREVGSAMETVMSECAGLRDRLNSAERELNHYRSLEKAMHEALILAQKSADEIRASARTTADSQLQDAHSRVADMNQKLDSLRSERRRIICDLRATLNAQVTWLDRELDAETLSFSAEETSLAMAELMPFSNSRDSSTPFRKEWQAVSR